MDNRELDAELNRIIRLLERHFGREPTVDEVYIYYSGTSAEKRSVLDKVDNGS